MLQGCRALVERRHDVQVNPPRKGATDGRGTVTGAPEDVAGALVELKKLLCRTVEPGEPQNHKAKKGKAHVKPRGQKNNKPGSEKVNKP